MPPMKIGDTAPAFELPTDKGETVRLSDFAGKKVVLFFYPRADTPTCTVEACAFRDDYSAFLDLEVAVLGISPDTVKAQSKFSRKFGLPYPLLADADHQVAEAYGVKADAGVALRGLFLIDPEGTIMHATINNLPVGRSAKEALRTLSAFQFTTLDPNEIVTIVGTGVEYPFNSTLTGIVDYKNYDYELAGEADYFGGRLAYAVRDYSAGLSLYRMDGETDRLKYGEYRAYAQKQWAKTDATVDLLVVSYDEEINGVKNVYTAVAAVGYAFNAQARAVADLEYGRNPEFDKEVRAMVHFVYRFDVSSR